MIAAIVPHGDSAWFFKLTGATKVVADQAAAFEALVKSVTFAEGKPKWTLPAGWRQKPESSPMRYATLIIDTAQPPLEVTVTTLPWQTSSHEQSVLANINRWRTQMKQLPLAASDLGQQTRSIKLENGQAVLVDFEGTFTGGPMSPGMAPRAGKSEQTGADAPAGKAEAVAPAAAVEQASENLPMTFDVPAGWASSQPPMFAVAAFTAQREAGKVEVTVTPLAAAGGALLPNVNRWRTQLGLPPVSADELPTAARPYKVDGLDGHLVRLVGPEQSTPRSAIVVAVVEREGTSWFFRMRGPADAAEAQMQNFEKFVGSVKFRAGEN